jgi:sec-independent protein translocase protein TatA
MFTGALQPMHLLIILIIALVVFGPSKLPELGSSLGKGIREFRKTTDEFRDIKAGRQAPRRRQRPAADAAGAAQ